MAERIRLSKKEEEAAELVSVLNNPAVSLELDINRNSYSFIYDRSRVMMENKTGTRLITCGVEFGSENSACKKEGWIEVNKEGKVFVTKRVFDFITVFSLPTLGSR